MYEHRTQKLLSRELFLRRLARHGGLALLLVFGSLLLGVLGFHLLGREPWLDALVNAAMLLGGMGPVNPLQTNPGKIFASFYALYSGIVLLASVGVLAAPLFHRILHRFHLEIEGE